jgi:hypothetical protein
MHDGSCSTKSARSFVGAPQRLGMDQRLVLFREVELSSVDDEGATGAYCIRERNAGHIRPQKPLRGYANDKTLERTGTPTRERRGL